MAFRTYADALAHLNTFTDYERQSGTKRAYRLDRMRRLIEAVGRPDRSMTCVHIAGTKGKGSTAHLAEAVLRAHGLRTGLYTSPHLVDMLERIRIDGQPVAEGDFVRAMNAMKPALDRLRPTYFETMTAAAFEIFRSREVDVAVVEVGLGGRLDATNVIDPVVCGITRIDYDHMDKLGSTLEAIAGEKAGIAKQGVDVVTSEIRPGPLGVIARAAHRLVRVGQDLRLDTLRAGAGLAFRVNGAQAGAIDVQMPVLGAHQAENAAVAVGLAERVIPLDPAKVSAALRRARLPGRVEIVSKRPLVILDTAHNPFAARSTRAALKPFDGRRWTVVFGGSSDKDVRGMIRELRRPRDRWILTRASSPRATAPADLLKFAPGAVPLGSVDRALALAIRRSGPKDLILVTGSFYVAGEALEFLRRR